MKKWISGITLALLLSVGILQAATISQTPLVPRALRSTDRVPMGFPGNDTAYTLSMGQVLTYVFANQTGAHGGGSGGGSGDMLAATYDPSGAHANVYARANHTGTQAATTITGLATVATSGSYLDLSNRPTIPAALSDLTGDSTHRVVTDAQAASWTAKQASLVAGTDYLAPTGSGAGLTGITAAQVGAVSTSVVGANSGVATLDSSGKLTTSQLPSSVVGAVVYKGVWNAGTNSPSLSSGVGVQGNYYTVSTAGGTTLDGVAPWAIGDWAIFNGTRWDKVQGNSTSITAVTGTAPVVSSGGTTPAISMAAATDSVPGYLTAADHAAFAAKQAALVSATNIKSVNGFSLLGAGDLTINSMVYPGAGVPVSTGTAWGTPLNITAISDSTATTSSTTAASATAVKVAYDLATTKGSGTLTAVTGTAPVVSSGGTTPAISMAAATDSVPGYLTAADHTTFAAKQAALGYTPLNPANNLSDVTAATARTNLGLAIGSNVQAYNANLSTYAGIAPSANAQTLLGHTFSQMATDIGALANPMTASGSVIYGGTAGVPTELVKGTDGYVLTLASGLPAWAAPSGGVSGSSTTGYWPYWSSSTGLSGTAVTASKFVCSDGSGHPTACTNLVVASGKTLTASNTLTLAGTDSSTLNIGAGGTLGTSAFMAGPTGAMVGTTDTQTLTNKTFTGYTETTATPTVSAGAVTISLANGTVQKVVTSGNTTITLPSPVAGTSYTIAVQYGGVDTVTWAGGGTIKFSNGVAPTATASSGKTDFYVFQCLDGTYTFGTDGGRNY